MMKITCNRCGKLIDDVPRCAVNAPAPTVEGYDKKWNRFGIHLCDDCTKALLEWLKDTRTVE